VVEDGALVGMGSIVCQRARLERGAMLAAGSVLSERSTIRSGMLGAGVPAREKKPLEGVAEAWTRTSAQEYQRLAETYRRVATTRGG
jgi:carbonic anhydrase/acetyltransferase-like protein (isoleucine patch superfamily)